MTTKKRSAGNGGGSVVVAGIEIRATILMAAAAVALAAFAFAPVGRAVSRAVGEVAAVLPAGSCDRQ
jgi:hypothetical protein